jgi:hypothetical protein
MTLYHFTSIYHLPRIKQDGYIRPTASNLSLYLPRQGPDVVWLMDRPDPGDYHHGLRGSGVNKRAVRIAVNITPFSGAITTYKWTLWARSLNMDESTMEALITSGGGRAAANMWWVCPAPIPSDY